MELDARFAANRDDVLRRGAHEQDVASLDTARAQWTARALTVPHEPDDLQPIRAVATHLLHGLAAKRRILEHGELGEIFLEAKRVAGALDALALGQEPAPDQHHEERAGRRQRQPDR